jgi:uncharacterized protein
MILYKIKAGSFLYGLTTPSSDLDYTGVYIEDKFNEFIDPFNTKDEIDLSVKSKLENGKNDSDAVDEKYYHLKKFIKLCADNNPNILEMLFSPKECIEYVHPVFKELILDHPEMFVNKKLIDRFIGYAKSQEQKSYTKSDNYIHLNNFLTFLHDCQGYKGITEHYIIGPMIEELYLEEVDARIENKPGDIVYEIGGMKFPSGITFKEAIARIDERFARASHRVDGIFINKYEPKFMSHTIRLLDEGYQLLTTGKIQFPFTGNVFDDIMSVKLGKTKVEDIPELVNGYKERLSLLETNCTLPKTADYETIKRAYNTLVLKTLYWDICKFMDETGLYGNYYRGVTY